jgi:hypothetical protein
MSRSEHMLQVRMRTERRMLEVPAARSAMDRGKPRPMTRMQMNTVESCDARTLFPLAKTRNTKKRLKLESIVARREMARERIETVRMMKTYRQARMQSEVVESRSSVTELMKKLDTVQKRMRRQSMTNEEVAKQRIVRGRIELDLRAALASKQALTADPIGDKRRVQILATVGPKARMRLSSTFRARLDPSESSSRSSSRRLPPYQSIKSSSQLQAAVV